jgi:LmbE family N-acetylglucosaminyl deacetylase
MSVDLISKLDKIIESIKPDIMYSPWIGDLHQDHRVIAEACSSASRIGNRFFIKNVFCYEVPSSTDQGFMRSVNPFIPNYYLRLNEGDVDMKVNMMLEYGAEQSSLRSPGAIRELAKKRGRECESIFAESFMCMRRVDE